MTNRSAPHNATAEADLLGAVLLDPLALDDLAVELSGDDFYVHKHRWIWDALQTLARAGELIDTTTVGTLLDKRGQLSEIGGTAYLAKLVSDTPHSFHAPAYAALVVEQAERRRLIELATALAKNAMDVERAPADTRAEAMAQLIAAQKLTGGAVPLKVVLDALYDDIKSRADNPEDVFGIPTGFADFDKITAGLQVGEVLYIAGEPGTGKSLLAAQMAANMARAKRPGAMYELEMGSKQLARRTVAALSGVTTKAMRSGRVADHEWPLLVHTFGEASSWPLYLSDFTGWTTTSLRADLSRLKQTAGIEWFVIDYFALLQDSHGKDENERQNAMSKAVKRLCKDLELAGVVVHSMNKQGMGATVKRLEHISGSGQISFDADLVCFLTNHIPGEGMAEDRNLRTLTFAKYREDESNRLLHLVKRPGLPAFGDYVPDPNASVKARVRANGKGN